MWPVEVMLHAVSFVSEIINPLFLMADFMLLSQQSCHLGVTLKVQSQRSVAGRWTSKWDRWTGEIRRFCERQPGLDFVAIHCRTLNSWWQAAIVMNILNLQSILPWPFPFFSSVASQCWYYIGCGILLSVFHSVHQLNLNCETDVALVLHKY